MSLLELPGVGTDWSEFVKGRAEAGLARAREVVAELKSGTGRTPAETVALLNEGDIALANASSFTSLLAEVHPDGGIRTACEDYLTQAAILGAERGQDTELYAVLAAVEATELDEQQRRLLERSLRDFRRSGVDKDQATRDRLKAIVERTTAISQDFSRNIRDDVRTIKVTPEQLDGLPQDFIDAHPVDADGLVTLTTDYPDVIPFRTFARDADARRRLHVEFLNRAWPANDALLQELLALRTEQAALLGYAGWPDFDAEVKMIGKGQAIIEFIDKITDLATESSDRDVAVLLARAQQDRPDLTALTAADSAYYSELIRRENFEVDAQLVRTYFDFGRVRAGLLDVTGKLFGLEYREVADAPRWHQDVTAYDVVVGGSVIGRIYLDLHPREGKYKHAAQFDIVSGVSGTQLPEGALVCNFPRGLMEHSDVVTLFHEFGHLVHHVLGGDQRFVRFSGVATEWDFVEAPSQMLEEWAWDPAVLASFGTNAAGEPIPAALVERMRTAKEFGRGYFARTQMFYAALSYVLHAGPVDDITATVQQLQAKYDAFDYLPGTHFHASFGHLEGYTSGYYTYMWSMVIAKDLFSAFNAADLFDTSVSYAYRDKVLAGGGSKDAADLVADFLGRPYDFTAFGRWLSGA